MKKVSSVMKLFWLFTDCHHEDWFVIAPNPKRAIRLFADYEDFDRTYPEAVHVMDIPAGITTAEGIADLELLKRLGADIQLIGNPIPDSRVKVVLQGETYIEGYLEEAILKKQCATTNEDGLVVCKPLM